MNRKELAENYFKQGYNCSQAVVLAYKDLLNIEEKDLLKLASSFGGGISRLRETCGAVSGMMIVSGLLYGYNDPNSLEDKNKAYALNQELVKEFETKNNSIICRELLNLKVHHDSPNSKARDENFYQTRPCLRLIGEAAQILENYINKQKENNI